MVCVAATTWKQPFFSRRWMFIPFVTQNSLFVVLRVVIDDMTDITTFIEQPAVISKNLTEHISDEGLEILSQNKIYL
jgi:hypothetical protein